MDKTSKAQRTRIQRQTASTAKATMLNCTRRNNRRWCRFRRNQPEDAGCPLHACACARNCFAKSSQLLPGCPERRESDSARCCCICWRRGLRASKTARRIVQSSWRGSPECGSCTARRQADFVRLKGSRNIGSARSVRSADFEGEEGLRYRRRTSSARRVCSRLLTDYKS